jgi:hypothetical protein
METEQTSSAIRVATDPDRPSRRSIYVVAILAVAILLVLLLLGGIGLLRSAAGPAPLGPLPPLEQNWLVVLFRMNLPGSGVSESELASVGPTDLIIMAVFAILSVCVYAALGPPGRVLSMIAVSLALLGIPVFLATELAGRSAVLLATLLLSAAELRGSVFGRRGAYAGIAAGALLLFGGDIATAVFPPSAAVAALLMVGYLMWLVWLLSMAAAFLGRLTR